MLQVGRFRAAVSKELYAAAEVFEDVDGLVRSAMRVDHLDAVVAIGPAPLFELDHAAAAPVRRALVVACQDPSNLGR